MKQNNPKCVNSLKTVWLYKIVFVIGVTKSKTVENVSGMNRRLDVQTKVGTTGENDQVN